MTFTELNCKKKYKLFSFSGKVLSFKKKVPPPSDITKK